ncbi:MAG TPA: DUF4153 domain-containing protein [Chitinivibrionales bacterium]|nr:DUF4153 domain-containing protein [Chitinivibrionales bacterium]
MKFKLLSLRELSSATQETVRRFPFLTLFLIVGAANHLFMDIFKLNSLNYFSRNLFMSILVLVPLLYSIRMAAESEWIQKKLALILELCSVAFTALYFFSLPNAALKTSHESMFWLYLVISCLLPFISVKSCLRCDTLFWHLHANLFSRSLITALYTVVILGGTSTALAAIDALFKTKLLEHQEIRIVIVTLWIFTPLFFLAGVPELRNTEEITAYKPGWIKNIALFVLLPLTTVYLGILYAYTGKIIAQWKLPDGMVSYLVLSFAAFGIASLMIVFPFQKDENSKWSAWFGRPFYYLQFPLLVLLAVAIYTRASEYGVTFRRYYVVELAVWLLFISVFMTVRKNKNLIMVPLSLFAFAFCSSFGPWSADNVSFLNQKARLNAILRKYSLIENGKLAKSRDELPKKVKADICSITKYLYDYDRLGVFSGFSNSKDTLTPKAFALQLGISYKERWQWNYDEKEWFGYSLYDTTYAVDKNDFDYFVKMSVPTRNAQKPAVIEKGRLTVAYDGMLQGFVFSSPGAGSSTILLKDVIAAFEKGPAAGCGKVGLYLHEDGNFSILCMFENLSGRKKETGLDLSTVNVDFLVKKVKRAVQ